MDEKYPDMMSNFMTQSAILVAKTAMNMHKDAQRYAEQAHLWWDNVELTHFYEWLSLTEQGTAYRRTLRRSPTPLEAVEFGYVPPIQPSIFADLPKTPKEES